jgi:hypothetical protein
MQNSIAHEKAARLLGLHLTSIKKLVAEKTLTELPDGSLCSESVNAHRQIIDAERNYIFKTECRVSFNQLSIAWGKSMSTLNRRRESGHISIVEDSPKFVEATEARRILQGKPLLPEQKQKNMRIYRELRARKKEMKSLLTASPESL